MQKKLSAKKFFVREENFSKKIFDLKKNLDEKIFVSDEELAEVSKKIMARNKFVYVELAK